MGRPIRELSVALQERASRRFMEDDQRRARQDGMIKRLIQTIVERLSAADSSKVDASHRSSTLIEDDDIESSLDHMK